MAVVNGFKMSYEEKLKTVFSEILNKNGSVSAIEVHSEMKERGWLSPLDTFIDTHKLLVELFGRPDNRE